MGSVPRKGQWGKGQWGRSRTFYISSFSRSLVGEWDCRPVPIRGIGAICGSNRLFQVPSPLSRVHAVAVSRGAAESAEREPVTNDRGSVTIHQTVTAQLTSQVSFSLRDSASPREPVPAFNGMDTA
jgi:hypothetical protein